MKKIWLLLLLLFPLLLALGLPRLIGRDAEPAMVVQCADPVRGCQVPIGNGVAEIRFSSVPVPFKPFDLTVRTPVVEQVFADFTMQGMDMGLNRYTLQRTADGVLQGKIILPMCVSGESNWMMTLELDGAKRQIPFVAIK